MAGKLAWALGTMLAMTSVPLSAAPERSKRVNTADVACQIVKSRISTTRHFRQSDIASCDIIPDASTPEGYYLLSLHSRRHCNGICSTNMGWFAVEKKTGRVFEWDWSKNSRASLIQP
jgi:hypothetical protein